MPGNPVPSRRQLLGLLAGGGALAATAGPAAAQAAAAATHADVAIDKVPDEVKKAAEAVLPKATWLSAVKVTDGGNVAYELDGKAGKDREMSILVNFDGKTKAANVVEVEQEVVNLDPLPDRVKAAHAAVVQEWENFVPTEINEIHRGANLTRGPKGAIVGAADHLFDMRGTIVKGRHIEVQVTDKGVIEESTVEWPLEKVPQVVKDALAKKRKNFEIGTAYIVREGGKVKSGGTVVGYHFEGKGPKGRDLTISVDPKGTDVQVIGKE